MARPLLRPLERMTYRLMGLDPNNEQDWKQYTFAMLFFSLVGCVFTYGFRATSQLAFAFVEVDVLFG